MAKVRAVLVSLVTAALLAAACGDDETSEVVDPTADASATHSVRVVVDYSPTVSDVGALLYLTQHPRVDLRGVTLAGTGESHCAPGVLNTVGLLALIGAGEVAVACGPEAPLGPGHDWPPEWRAAADELSGLTLPPTDTRSDLDAVDLLASIAAEGPEPITIVALGPLTNIGLALQRHPAFADDVAMIYTMGGALDVDGNVDGGFAEWNYFIDPTSVEVVLNSGIDITMIPLDATNDVAMTEAWFDRLADHRTTAAAAAVFDLHAETRPFELGFFFWDELAAAVALEESLVRIEERPVSIDTGGDTPGRVRHDPDGTVVRVALGADRARFETELLAGLNAGATPPEPMPRENAPSPATLTYLEEVAASTAAMGEGVEALFSGPEAASITSLGDDPRAELDTAQQEEVRAFMHNFWTVVTQLLEDHRQRLVTLEVPDNLSQEHEELLAAIDALVATRDERLAAIDGLDGRELLDSLWAPTPELNEFERACGQLQATTDAIVGAIQVCP